ncbi:GDP-L-fucose synthase [Candidatus Pelagibacter sp.]|nr:GDP-L-fucose synthase [Candidatus Pelagibacter sp.]
MSNKILIAGQEGMVGGAVYRLFKTKKLNIINCKRKDLDFTSQNLVNKWFKKHQPDIVVNAAGLVGGIMDNYKFQSDYIYINTMIGMNIVNASLKFNVKKLINLGSSCIYPKNVKQPIKEMSLLSSSLEKTNEGYALSKIVTLKYCQYLKKKYKKNFISILPANLYGVGDNFDLESSHVLPALVKKFVLAKLYNKDKVEVWGTGKARREFLNVEDLASAIYFLTKKNLSEDYINIGSGEDFLIKDLAFLIKKTIKYKGNIVFNKNYPDGVRLRKTNSSIIKKLGWSPKIRIRDGIKNYCNYYLNTVLPNENLF